MIRVVLDTNVVVSALLKPRSNPSSALLLCLAGRGVELSVSDEILSEYEQVLLRPKFGFDPEVTLALLAQMRKRAAVVDLSAMDSFSVSSLVKDPDDVKFLLCAVAADAQFLVTGNTRHFVITRLGPTRIVTPSEFVDLFLR